MKKLVGVVVGAGIAGMVVSATLALGHEEAGNMTGPAKARHEAMETVKDHFVPLVKMVKGAAPFDAATVRKNAEIIAQKLQEASRLFPEGSDRGETRAKPEIWSNRAEFDAIMQTAIEKAKALAKADAPEKLMPAVIDLGGKGCKACHEKFRKPKEKK